MEIYWNITTTDIEKVKNVVAENMNGFTKTRQLRNVEKQNIVVDKNRIIKTMIMCLLTSQQRSGTNSPVGQFLRLKPFPIEIESIAQVKNVKDYFTATLRQFGLTRYVNRISKFFAENYKKIQNEDWSLIRELDELKSKDSKIEERIMADKLAEKFKGFGPKQSRNFLQTLGLTKYEIPIDSRITNWLNHFGFPVELTSSSLGDKNYYHFVLDGIQELCQKADIYPCILDAAIFSSFDKEEWTLENTIF